MTGCSEIVDAQGHLIDSGDLQAILTTIVDHGASYKIERFEIGRTNEDPSRLSLSVIAESRESLTHLLEKLSPFGCYVHKLQDALLREADVDAALYVGDDLTDLDAFRGLRELAETGRLEHALCVGVRSEETPGELEASADLLVDGTREVRQVLEALLE